jgi:ankyrin repeat protein
MELARDCRTAELEELLAAGADVAAVSPAGDTALHWAAYRGTLPAAQALLEAGADVDAAGECGNRPLHLAATAKHHKVRPVDATGRGL